MKDLAEVVVRELVIAKEGLVRQEQHYWKLHEKTEALEKCVPTLKAQVADLEKEIPALKAQVADLERRLKIAQDDGFKNMEDSDRLRGLLNDLRSQRRRSK